MEKQITDSYHPLWIYDVNPIHVYTDPHFAFKGLSIMRVGGWNVLRSEEGRALYNEKGGGRGRGERSF